MPKLALFLLLVAPLTTLIGQETKTGPVIGDYGAVFAVPEADLTLSTDATHKVLFDIYTDQGGEKDMNPLLTTVARFMNMHGQTGVKKEQMEIVVILHGAGLKNGLSDFAYNSKYKRDNPNAGLMEALDQAGVELYVCGQSMNARGYSQEDLAQPVKISLSAMTALVHFQEQGYRIINFN